jgi:hypothetical protein
LSATLIGAAKPPDRHGSEEDQVSGDSNKTVAVGFSPRKAQTAVYLTGALEEYDDLLARLGPHQTGKGCLYLKRADQADTNALRDIIARSYRAATG